MVEFRTLYYGPMDRDYHQSATETPEQKKLEDPIYPISQLGETVPENLGGRNIIQTTQAAIRGGAGTIQLVLLPPPDTVGPGSVGSRIGKEVREAVKELALANNVNIAGVELPTSLRGLSGFDFQQNAFSEDVRKRNLDQVKDAIKFAADVGQGGEVDLLSWEFPRNIRETRDKNFQDVSEEQFGRVVDTRSGRVFVVNKKEVQYLPVDPNKDFEEVMPDQVTGEVKLNPLTWEQFEKWAEKEKTSPEELYIKKKLEAAQESSRGYKQQNERNAFALSEEIEKLRKTIEGLPEDKKKKMSEEIERLEYQRKGFIQSAQGQAQEIYNIEQQKKNLKPIGEYGVNKSAVTYAEAGIEAWRAFDEGMKKGTVKKIIHVGPEIGWPEFYGSHPDEFIGLIKKSRKKMIDLLTDKNARDPGTGEELKDPSGKPIANQFFDPRIDKKQADELAKKHIKGLFDTSHMGMWLAHFKPEIDQKTGTIESEERRLKRFNDWFTKQVERIAKDKDDIIGGIQLVDSGSASHGHLPPGEGIFPVKDTAKIFKEAGFKGFLVSEGHEEERFGQGRIRMKTWQLAGADIGRGYFGGPPLRWEPVGRNYFGKTYSPLFMFGSYSPSNDFKLWSEVPLE